MLYEQLAARKYSEQIIRNEIQIFFKRSSSAPKMGNTSGIPPFLVP